MTTVFCRIETDPVALFQFLQLNGYPYWFSLDRLSTPETLRVRILDNNGDPIGYMWGDWVEVGRFHFHLCALAGRSLPLFSSDLLDQLLRMTFWVGADEVVTNVDGHSRFPQLRRLLLRIGFSEDPRSDGGSDFALNLWSRYGKEDPAEDASQKPERHQG